MTPMNIPSPWDVVKAKNDDTSAIWPSGMPLPDGWIHLKTCANREDALNQIEEAAYPRAIDKSPEGSLVSNQSGNISVDNEPELPTRQACRSGSRNTQIRKVSLRSHSSYDKNSRIHVTPTLMFVAYLKALTTLNDQSSGNVRYSVLKAGQELRHLGVFSSRGMTGSWNDAMNFIENVPPSGHQPPEKVSAEFVHRDSPEVEQPEKGGHSETMTLICTGDVPLVLDFISTRLTARQCDDFVTSLRRIIEMILRDPDGYAGQTILTDDELVRVVSTFNNAPSPPLDLSTHQLFALQAANTPESTALSMNGHNLTYKALAAWAESVAEKLKSAGVRPGDMVGILLPRCPGLVAALLAVWRAEAAWVPFAIDASPAQLDELLVTARPAALITIDKNSNSLRQATAAPVITLTEWPAQSEIEGHFDSTAWTNSTNHRQLAYVMHTSGTTGSPKGVMVEHGGLINYLAEVSRVYSSGKAGSALFSPITFDLGLPNLFVPLITGTTSHLIDPTSEATALGKNLMQCGKLDFLKMTPGQMSIIARQLTPIQRENLADVIVTAGDEYPFALAEAWRDGFPPNATQKLFAEYGPTETTVGNSIESLDFRDSLDLVPIGRPIQNTTMYVLDESLAPLPVGFTGEIYIGGVGVSAGYLNDPTRTADRFLPDPYGNASSRLYKTGDLGYHLPDGRVAFLGRNDRQVKVDGYRIELSRIESCLLDHPEVAEAAVVVEGEGNEKRLISFYLTKPANPPVTSENFKSFLKDRLPSYAIPREFRRLRWLPLTKNGKLDRQALASGKYALGHARPTYASVLAAITGLDHATQVDLGSNLFDLGFSSIQAMQLVADISRATNVEIQMSTLMANPTVEALRSHLSQMKNSDQSPDSKWSAPVLLLREGIGSSPIFWVHPSLGTPWPYSKIVRLLRPEIPVYGLRSDGLTNSDYTRTSMTEIADQYIREVQRLHPDGPYRLAGWSFGGVLAHLMASRLVEAGRTVDLLALLDSNMDGNPAGEMTNEGTEAAVLSDLLDSIGRNDTKASFAENVSNLASYLHVDDDRKVLDLISRFTRTKKTYLQLLSEYDPPKADVPALLFSAEFETYDPPLPEYWSSKVTVVRSHSLKVTHNHLPNDEGAIAKIAAVINSETLALDTRR